MGELQTVTANFELWQLFIFCLYPIALFVLVELLFSGFDDDDDQGGGMMIPAYQGAK